MNRPRFFLCAAMALLFLSGCNDGEWRQPTEPSAPTTVEGSALKVPSPVLLTPPDLADIAPTSALVLRFDKVRGTHASFTPSYDVELWNPAGTFRHQSTFPSSSSSSNQVTIKSLVEADVPLLWRVRATFEGHPGPWSSQRSLRVTRTASIGGGSKIERGEETPLTLRLTQQGITSNCLGPATWASDRPNIASVSPGGIVTAYRLGVVTIGATCESAVDTKVLTVIETWRADLQFKSCRLAVGDGRSCWNSGMAEGAAGVVRLELTESGSVVIGELSMPGIGPIPFSGTISSDNRLSGSGRKVTCGESGTRLMALEVLDDRLDLRIREADGPGCVPAGPSQREWQVVADMDRLNR